MEVSLLKNSEVRQCLNDTHREVRVIRALHSRDCLGQQIQERMSASIAESQSPPLVYQNTGIQTLPPPDGDTFQLIHGHKPSEVDYVLNTGTAAVGRFTVDPRFNPHELIYGAAYLGPRTARQNTYVDAEFQTASYDAVRMAVAKAKVKASLMAARYGQAAFRAGYIVAAEPNDKTIVHSEQYPTTARLDEKGNLLDGTPNGVCLPNISGTLLQSQTTTSPSTNHLPPPQVSTSTSKNLANTTLSKIQALAPTLTKQTLSPAYYYDNEYGSGELSSHECVVYDARSASRLVFYATSTSPVSHSRKRKLDQLQQDDDSVEGYRNVTLDTRRKFARSAAPSPPPISFCSDRCVNKSGEHAHSGNEVAFPPPSQQSCAISRKCGRERTPTMDHSAAVNIPKINVARLDDTSELYTNSAHTRIPPVDERLYQEEPSVKQTRILQQAGDRQVGRGNITSKEAAARMKGKKLTSERSSTLSTNKAYRLLHTSGNEEPIKSKRQIARIKQSDDESPTHDRRREPDLRLRAEIPLFNDRAKKPRDELSGRKGDALQKRTAQSEPPNDDVSIKTVSDKTDKKLSRVIKSARLPLVPYVPPALRARAEKSSKDAKKL